MVDIEVIEKKFEEKIKELNEKLPTHYEKNILSTRNCAAWTISSIMDILEIDNLNFINMATPLASIIGNCGAVAGGLMSIGLILGKKGKKELHHLRASGEGLKFIKVFKKKHDTIKCQELTGIDLLSTEGQQNYMKENLWEKKCYKFIISAVEIIGTLYKGKIAKLI